MVTKIDTTDNEKHAQKLMSLTSYMNHKMTLKDGF